MKLIFAIIGTAIPAFLAWTAIEVVSQGREITKVRETVRNNKELMDERTDRIYYKLERMDNKLDRIMETQ